MFSQKVTLAASVTDKLFENVNEAPSTCKSQEDILLSKGDEYVDTQPLPSTSDILDVVTMQKIIKWQENSQ